MLANSIVSLNVHVPVVGWVPVHSTAIFASDLSMYKHGKYFYTDGENNGLSQ